MRHSMGGISRLIGILFIVFALAASSKAGKNPSMRASSHLGKNPSNRAAASQLPAMPPRKPLAKKGDRYARERDLKYSGKSKLQKLNEYQQIDGQGLELEAEPYSPDSSYWYTTFDYYAFNTLNAFQRTSNCYFETESDYKSENGNLTIDLQWCYGHQTRHIPPPCVNQSDLVFNNETGAFSADQTFYNCLANIDDVASIPTFYNGYYHGCLFINSDLTLLNLVRVSEVDGTAELQLIIDLQWVDYRYNMDLFWDNVHVGFSLFDVTDMLLNDSITMWLPEIVFPDAQSITILSQTLLLAQVERDAFNYKEGGTLFQLELTVDVVLVQPKLDISEYPNDDQHLDVRYAVLNFDAQQLQIFPGGVYCSYLPDGTCSFANNPIWKWKNDPSEFACTTYYDEKFSGTQIFPAYAYYSIRVQRSARGVIVRLVLPLALLLLLSALTFWLSYDQRVDTTITLLLSVSALYIVILQNIPLVGYLTAVDQFVFWMFFLLCLVCGMHQLYATVHEKRDIWPIRYIYLRLIEMSGRVVVMPAVIIYFMATMKYGTQGQQIALYFGMTLVTVCVAVREAVGVHSAYHVALRALIEKLNSPTTTMADISVVEAVVINHYVFRTWSTNLLVLSRHIAKNGPIRFVEPKEHVELHNYATFHDMIAEQKEGAATDTPAKAVHSAELHHVYLRAAGDDPVLEMTHMHNGHNGHAQHPQQHGYQQQLADSQDDADSDEDSQDRAPRRGSRPHFRLSLVDPNNGALISGTPGTGATGHSAH